MNKLSCRKLAKLDPRLAEFIRRIGPIEITIPKRADPYAALVQSIAYQQLHANAARSIFKRFKDLFPRERFPKAQSILKLKTPDLRAVGFSENKSKSILDIALKFEEGLIPSGNEARSLTDQELIERLTQIRGVGPWTVQMFLLFEMGRPDIWPISDFGVQAGYKVLFGKKIHPKPKQLILPGEKWKPLRSTAALYLWKLADLNKTQ